MARSTGLMGTLLSASTRWPWWISATLAIVTYFALQPWATMDLTPAVSIKEVGDQFNRQILHAVATVLQYFIPTYLLFGATISATRPFWDALLLKRVAEAEEFGIINWREFERVVGETFRRKGYAVELKGGDQPDGGVDLVVSRHGKRYLVQCKQWRNAKVGVKPVRELYGVVAAQHADGGFVVTTGRFTAEAHRFAAGQAIYLMDGADLRAVVRELHPERAQEETATKPSEARHPICPHCAAPMVRRTARKGPNAGNDFLGCSRYPSCTGSLPLHEHA